MIVFAFALFALLLVGWLAAPAGTEEKALKTSTPAPILTVGEVLA